MFLLAPVYNLRFAFHHHQAQCCNLLFCLFHNLSCRSCSNSAVFFQTAAVINDVWLGTRGDCIVTGLVLSLGHHREAGGMLTGGKPAMALCWIAIMSHLSRLYSVVFFFYDWVIKKEGLAYGFWEHLFVRYWIRIFVWRIWVKESFFVGIMFSLLSVFSLFHPLPFPSTA